MLILNLKAKHFQLFKIILPPCTCVIYLVATCNLHTTFTQIITVLFRHGLNDGWGWGGVGVGVMWEEYCVVLNMNI